MKRLVLVASLVGLAAGGVSTASAQLPLVSYYQFPGATVSAPVVAAPVVSAPVVMAPSAGSCGCSAPTTTFAAPVTAFYAPAASTLTPSAMSTSSYSVTGSPMTSMAAFRPSVPVFSQPAPVAFAPMAAGCSTCGPTGVTSFSPVIVAPTRQSFFRPWGF